MTAELNTRAKLVLINLGVSSHGQHWPPTKLDPNEVAKLSNWEVFRAPNCGKVTFGLIALWLAENGFPNWVEPQNQSMCHRRLRPRCPMCGALLKTIHRAI